MSLSTIMTGVAIDLGKKYVLDAGKKVAHDFADSATGKRIGVIIDYRKQGGNNNVLLFVHGFSGSSSETFGTTPDMLIRDDKFAGWDVFSIGYSTDIFPSIGKGIWSVNPDITKVALYLNTLLKNQFAAYDRIAFVAHSMGGLAVQRAILDAEQQFRQKLSHVIFFGTPSAGLRKAFWFRFWNTDLKDLSDKSDFIRKLRKDWSDTFKGKLPFTFKTIAGSKDEFVPTSSSLEPFNKEYWGVIEGNHITMIKPKDITDLNSQIFEIIVKTIVGQDIDLKGDRREINLLLGEYRAVINKYYDSAKKIALRPLADLVFALECTGRKDDALRVLQEHPQANTDSDTLGIIGGRYKRRYLLDGLQNDLDMAIGYYKNALSLSQEKSDAKQVHYHAINLAFLSLVGNRNETEMVKYARLALDNCVSVSKDVWELATVAEANLYLRNTKTSEEYYRKTAALAGIDERTKGSIYSNAYYGYIALTTIKKNDDEFLKMLEEVFLG